MPASLQDQLDEITANTRHLVQPERLAVSERAVEELFASGIEDTILPVGAVAPEFALNDAITAWWCAPPICSPSGPLVLKFFPRRWCPYCITELEAWRDLYARFASAARSSSPSARRPSARATSWSASTGCRFPCSPTPAARSPDNSASLDRPRLPPRLLPLDPRQHSVREWRPELALTASSHVCDRARPLSRLRRGPRRLPRMPAPSRKKLSWPHSQHRTANALSLRLLLSGIEY